MVAYFFAKLMLQRKERYSRYQLGLESGASKYQSDAFYHWATYWSSGIGAENIDV